MSRNTTDSSPITRSQANLIAVAEACSHVRRDVGRLFMTRDGTDAREQANRKLRASLRALLRRAKDEDCGLFLEVASEL